MATDPRHRPRMLQNVVIGVALFAELIALVGHVLFGWGPGPPPMAATPPPLVFQAPVPPSGAEVLARLADVSAGRPDPPAGRYAYVRRRTWQLDVTNDASPPTQVRPALVESWLTRGGAGDMRTTVLGDAPSRPWTRSVAGPGLPALTPDATRLAAALGFDGRPGHGSAAQFTAFAALAARQPLMPRVRAMLELLLARVPGLIDSGTVLDRAGRSGVGVSLDSSTSSGRRLRIVLIFDPVTGALLESDETLQSEPGRLPVHEGAVLSYTTILASGFTRSP